MATTMRLLVCLVLFAFAIGCGYGGVGPTAYEYAKALYSITNRQAGDQLELVRGKIDTERVAGQLTSEEADWLHGIIDTADDGEWKAANRACRQLMDAQVQ